jgi:phage shock protein A
MTENSFDTFQDAARPAAPGGVFFGLRRWLARELGDLASRLDPTHEPLLPALEPPSPPRSVPPPRAPSLIPVAAAILPDNSELAEKAFALLESGRSDVLTRITGVNTLTERETLAAGAALKAIVSESQTQVNEMRATLEQLGGSDGRVGVPQLAARQSSAVRAYLQRMKDIIEVHDRTVQTSHQSTERIAEIGRSVAKLAFQARLLSLNAAIEAARLGGTGNAFSVIAEEMTRLSNETDGANRRISDLADELLKCLPEVAAQTTEIRQTSAAFSEHMATELSELERTNGAFENRVRDALSLGDERIARVVAHSYEALSHLAFQDACAQRLLSVDAVLTKVGTALEQQLLDPTSDGAISDFEDVQRNAQHHAGDVVAFHGSGGGEAGGATEAGEVLLF